MKKQSTIICPVCGGKTGKNSLNKVKSLFPFDGAIMIEEGDFLSSFMRVIAKHSGFYQWACDDCIRVGVALLANPKEQHYKESWWDVKPFLAYYDKTFSCKDCGEDFLFSKEDQQYGYEKLKFEIFSRPVRCPECSKKVKAERQLNTELSELLKQGQPKDKASLLRIADIYEQMGITEKATYYQRAAQKK